MGIVVLFLAACGKKASDQHETTLENSTEVPTPVKKPAQKKEYESQNTKKILEYGTPALQKKSTTRPDSGRDLDFKDIDGNVYTLTLGDNTALLDGSAKKILMITLFSTWCPPCKGQLPYLEEIRHKHAEEISAIGFVVNDDIKKTDLRAFLARARLRFPVSRDEKTAKIIVHSLGLPENYPLPLTILYKNGKYLIHYEGAVPPEMIEHDITTPKDE